MNLISTFIIVILSIIGILFIIWSIIIRYQFFRLIKECTNRCEGFLIKINEIKIYHRVNDDGKWYSTKSYVPIYEYEVGGNKYKIKGTNGSGFKIGDVVKINYNPQNPKQCYIEGYSFTLWIILLIIGIIILIITTILFLLINFIK